MPSISEKYTPTDVFKFESGAEALFSRSNIVLLAGQAFIVGTVLGQIAVSGKYVQLAPAAADGSQIAAGILFSSVDSTAGDARAVLVVRDAIAADSRVIWPAGITVNQKGLAISQLGSNGVILRTGV